jgi:glycolate oxidase iron-sulfur subunit
MPWITEHPPREAELDACVTCGLCLPVCPTYRLTGDETASPRGRLAAIVAVAAGSIDVDERFSEVTSFCLQCRACETACPSLVPYGEIIEAARAEAVAQVPPAGGWLRRRVLGQVLATRWILRSVTLLAAALQRLGVLRLLPVVGNLTAGLRRLELPLPSAAGGTWGDPDGEPIILFTGCVADTWFPATHVATIQLLVRAGYRVSAVASQTCCGALAAHAGFAPEAERVAEINSHALAGDALIAVDVAGCGAHLKSYGRFGPGGMSIAERTRDVTELVAVAIRDGRLPILPATGIPVAVQDPCHLEHAQRITSEPREIVRAAGYVVVDADPSGLCCGAAGIYQLDHPDAGDELGRRKAAAVVATGSTIVASANAGCEMQLRRHIGSDVRICHPVELYAEALSAQG